MYVGGWYDLKEKSWRTIVDCSLIAAMGPAGMYTCLQFSLSIYTYLHILQYQFVYRRGSERGHSSLLAPFQSALLCRVR